MPGWKALVRQNLVSGPKSELAWPSRLREIMEPESSGKRGQETARLFADTNVNNKRACPLCAAQRFVNHANHRWIIALGICNRSVPVPPKFLAGSSSRRYSIVLSGISNTSTSVTGVFG